MEEFLTQVIAIKPLTIDVIEITVRLLAPTSIRYKAGQFVQFMIGDKVRSYSIANPPQAEETEQLVFCIKLEKQGIGSDYVRSLSIGSEVKMKGPAGIFTVEQFNKPLCFVATGVGIAPFASIIPDLLVRGFDEKIKLIFGLRSEENFFYYDKFNHLTNMHSNFNFIPMLSNPRSHWPGEVGRVTTYLSVSFPYLKDFLFYICGSSEMVLDTKKLLLGLGLPGQSIRTEIFTELLPGRQKAL